MKKIIMGIVSAALLCGSVFAADVAAKVTIEGNVASGDKDSFNVIGLNDTNFKDSKEILSFNFSGDNAGASFKIGTDDKLSVWGFKQEAWETWDKWWETKTSSSMTTNPGGTLGDLNIRGLNIWLKPIDMLKINLGSIDGEKTFCEHICWWHSPYSKGDLVGGYPGISLELTPPVDGLRVVASFQTDFGGFFATKDTYKKWGLLASYSFGDIRIAAGFKDEGKDAADVISVGGSYGNEWGGQFFGFVNVYVISDKNFDFNKMAIDNWFKINLSPITLSLSIPVGFSFDGNKLDLDWKLAFNMPIGSFGFYAKLGSGGALDRPMGETWGEQNYLYYDLKNFHFSMLINPGLTFNVGAAAMDVGVKFYLASNDDGLQTKWSIPFSAVVSF